ncbi:MAG: chemotaxis protein CheY [Microbacterium arborescens]
MTRGVAVRWATSPAGGRRAVADDLITEMLERAGVPRPRIDRVCARCGGEHGPVRVSDDGRPLARRAAVTYAGSWVVVAVSRGVGAFAIDAERRDLRADELGRLRRALGDLRADAATWTRVEAALKADGRGLRVEPSEVRLSWDGDLWWARVPDRAEPLRVREIPGPADLVISLAEDPGAASARSTNRRRMPPPGPPAR